MRSNAEDARLCDLVLVCGVLCLKRDFVAALTALREVAPALADRLADRAVYW